MSRRTLLWVTFAMSGAIAYALAFLEGLWPLARYIAGWYAIVVIVAIVVVGIVTLSVKWGPVRYRPGLLDYFLFW